MELSKTSLTLYTDEIKHIVFLQIPRESIVAINKRQINRYDVFKFSLHYKINNTHIIKEIKLRARSRSDTDYWISTLRKIIQPKPYQFEYDTSSEEKASLLFRYNDLKKFYIAMCHLEYILHKDNMKDFFRCYNSKKKNNECNNNKTKADSNNKEKEEDDDDFTDIFNDDNISQNELKNNAIENNKKDNSNNEGNNNHSIRNNALNNNVYTNKGNQNHNLHSRHNTNVNDNQPEEKTEVNENEITLEMK